MRYSLHVLVLVLITSSPMFSQSIGINDDNSIPNAKSILDIKSSDKGILIPRLNTQQRLDMNLTQTEEGMMIYDTNTHSFWVYGETQWNEITTQASDTDWLKEGTTNVAGANGDDVYHVGKVAIGKDEADHPLDINGEDESTLVKIGGSFTTIQNETYYGTHSALTASGPGFLKGCRIEINGNSSGTITGQEVVLASSGNGGQFPIVAGMNGSGSGSQIGVQAYSSNNGSGFRATLSGSISGQSTGGQLHAGLFSLINSENSGENNGVNQTITNPGGGDSYGMKTYLLDNDGTGDRIGVFNDVKASSGQSYAMKNVMKSTSTGNTIGIHNNIDAGSESTAWAISNSVRSSGNTAVNGIANFLISDESTGATGLFNDLSGASSSNQIAIDNVIVTTGDGLKMAVSNFVDGTGSGKKYGTKTLISTGGTGEKYGSHNSITSDVSKSYGEYNKITSSSDLQSYGDYNELTSTGSGPLYGNYIDIAASGTGSRYGSYKDISFNGTQLGRRTYGDYNKVRGTTNREIYGYYNDIENSNGSIVNGTFNSITLNSVGVPGGAAQGMVNVFNTNDFGAAIGTNNSFSGTSNSAVEGLKNTIMTAGNGNYYGVSTVISSPGQGFRYGVFNKIVHTTSNEGATAFGTVNLMEGTGISEVYGTQNIISNTGNGNHYAGYFSAPGDANDYAAVFNEGNVVANESGGDYDFRIESEDNSHILFVDANENEIGIGTDDPEALMHVEDDKPLTPLSIVKNTSLSINSKGLEINLGANETSNDYITFMNGSTEVGRISGDGATGVSYSVTSDSRLKQNIAIYSSGLSLLSGIHSYSYQMKAAPDYNQIGFLAQELYDIFPAAVSGSPVNTIDNPMMVDYSKITPVLVSAIKEQQQIISQQSTDIKKQEKAIANLNARINKLEKMISQIIEEE